MLRRMWNLSTHWLVAFSLTIVTLLAFLPVTVAHGQIPPDPETEDAPPIPDAPNAEPPDFAQCGVQGDSSSWSPFTTIDPIYLTEGAVVERAVDMSIPGPVRSFTSMRSYNSRITGSSIMGGKWVSNAVDHRLAENGTDIDLVIDATSKRTFTWGINGYTSPDDSTLTLEEDTTNSQFVLTNWATGEVHLFHDFDATNPGFLKETTTLPWRDAGKDGITYTYNSSHQVTQITTAEGQEHNIVFTYTSDKITEIEARTGSDTSTRYCEVEYTYFNTLGHSQDVGATDDLVLVKLSRLKTGGSVGTSSDWIVRYYHYRYDSNGLLKAVYGPDAIERLIADRGDIDDTDDILSKGDDDDNSGNEDHKIKDYASRQFTYYNVDVKTDNSGIGTAQDPKCETVWAASGENLQSRYGGSDYDEVDSSNDKYLIKSETVGGCSSCSGGSGAVTREYFYMQIDHGTADANEVVLLVVEDLIDSDGNGIRRHVYGLSDSGRRLREVTITDPIGTPEFWCQSWKLEETGQKLNRLAEYRTPAAHNVSSSTVDEFLNPSHNGDYSNDNTTLNANAGLVRVYEYNTSGDRTGTKVKQGRTGTAYYTSATDYNGGTNENQKHLVTARYVFPEEETSRTATSRVATQYSYTFWTGTDTVRKRTTTFPAILTTENGSGAATTTEEYFDDRGRLRWKKDQIGYVTYHSYHPENGQLAYTVRDADPTALPSSADSNSTKWVTSSDGSASSNKPTRGTGLATALESVSRREFDDHGRNTLTSSEDGTDGTILARHYTVYETSRTLRFPYWDTSTNKPLLPIDATVFDDGGTVTDRYTVDPARTAQTSGVPTGLSSGTDQSHYQTWRREIHDDVSGELLKQHTYHDIPSTGYGSKDTNYAETVSGYDGHGRQDRTVSPDGTITRSAFNDVGRLASKWVGTDDTPTTGDWSPTNNSGANMTKVVEYQYDGGNSGGNGNRTKEIRYVTDDVEANARVTQFKYDWRDRQAFVVDPEEYSSKALYSRVELDNVGRVLKSERYWDADDDESFPTDGTVDSGDRLLSRSESHYDGLGRVYRTKRYAVDPDNGTVGNATVSDSWFDASGRKLKQLPGAAQAFNKTEYDGLGRITDLYVGFDTDETSYTDVDDVTGDTILQQTELTHDANGNLIQTTSYARKHTASGTGTLTTSTARVSYLASWFDNVGRQTATADYGTNGGVAFTRPSTAPTRADTVLVTSTEYNIAGQAYKITDPAGVETRFTFNDVGRVTKQIGSYTDGNPSTGDSDEDVTVEMAYNSSGKLTTLTAKNSTTGDQVAKYVYGTDAGGITPYIYRNDKLRAEIHPDSDDTTSLGNGTDGTYDRIEYLYNIVGDTIEKKDQNGTAHTLDYDDNGRLTHDRVSTLASGIDGTVRRVSTTYDIRGLREHVSTYDNATVGSGNVLNEVVFEYNDSGMPIREYQEHEGAKDASTLYVGYNYDTTASGGEYTKGLRASSVRYPNSRLVHLTYGTGGSTADATSRLDAIKDDSSGSPGNAFAEYDYLGSGRIVEENYTEPDVKLNYDSGTAGEYAGLDRFGRVVDHLWYDYGDSTDRDRFKYGYDRASNRLYRENTVASGRDECYTYDNVNRLATFDMGDLNTGKDAITGTPASEEDWGLDMTGNWSDFTQKTSGSTDLDQDRTHNMVNEITGISETVGTAWIDPVHDRAGNMTTIPKPSSPNVGLTCKWDAWNRLVEVKDGTTVVAMYEYDGLARRVKKHVDLDSPSSPDGVDAYEHFYYNSDWQDLEIRRSTNENTEPETLQPQYQFAWSQRYVDAPVLRDENSDGDGICDDNRLYYLGDANFNVTSLVTTAGDAIERYLYSPFGHGAIYNGDWSEVRLTSEYSIAHGFVGRRVDWETEFSYFRRCSYCATLGRFASRASVGEWDIAWNPYEFAQSSPTRQVDPLGAEVKVEQFLNVAQRTSRRTQQTTVTVDCTYECPLYCTTTTLCAFPVTKLCDCNRGRTVTCPLRKKQHARCPRTLRVYFPIWQVVVSGYIFKPKCPKSDFVIKTFVLPK